MRAVYLDHAATTPLDPRVAAAMRPYFEEEFGNPSALYALGRRAKDAVDLARGGVAAVLGCGSGEITFTSGGTESDNLAILGIARAYAAAGKHLVTTAIEHHAVLNAAKAAEKQGWSATYLRVDGDGLVDPAAVAAALTPETTLVSVMSANNEIGTVQPIREIAKAVRDWKKDHGRGPLDPPFVHTDACQAAGYLELDVRKLGVDLLTVNGSKIYGPKGVGLLYHRRGLRLEAQIHGGGQESRLRSGTENVAGIVGLAKALEIAAAEREVESVRLIPLRDRLVAGIMDKVSKVVANGHRTKRLPNNVNVSILDIEGEAALLYLDAKGISAATGSACDSASLDPSHVILALGKPYEYAHASVRFTLGRSTTAEDIDYVLEVLPEIVAKLRSISPVNLQFDGRGDHDIKKAFVDMGRPHWELKK